MNVTQLFLYPVKSMKGIPVNEAELSERGFQLDRRWMVVDENGLFISQRSQPKLAAIQVTVDTTILRLSTTSDPTGVAIPLIPKAEQPSIRVKVWKSDCVALGGFETANIWLSAQLSIKCQLVYMPEDTKRGIALN